LGEPIGKGNRGMVIPGHGRRSKGGVVAHVLTFPSFGGVEGPSQREQWSNSKEGGAGEKCRQNATILKSTSRV